MSRARRIESIVLGISLVVGGMIIAYSFLQPDIQQDQVSPQNRQTEVGTGQNSDGDDTPSLVPSREDTGTTLSFNLDQLEDLFAVSEETVRALQALPIESDLLYAESYGQ